MPIIGLGIGTTDVFRTIRVRRSCIRSNPAESANKYRALKSERSSQSPDDNVHFGVKYFVWLTYYETEFCEFHVTLIRLGHDRYFTVVFLRRPRGASASIDILLQ